MPGIDDHALLVLKGEGADGSTTIVDSSVYARPITRVGNVEIDTAHAKFGTSIKFGGGYLKVPDSDDFALANSNKTFEGDFTFENILATQYFFYHSDGARIVYFLWYKNPSGANLISFQIYGSGPAFVLSAPWTPTVGQKHNIQLKRQDGVLYITIDGVVIASTAIATPIPNVNGEFFLGATPTGANPFMGWWDEVRFSKVARSESLPHPEYTPPAPYIPPAAGQAENNHFKRWAAALDPDSMVYHCGVFNVVEDEPVLLLNGWQMNSNNNENFWYHRKGDVENGLLIPPGFALKHTGNPAGGNYTFNYGYVYYSKLSLVEDERYEDARELYYSRLNRLASGALEMRSAEVKIPQGATRTNPGPNNAVMLPNDSDRCIAVHQSMMDGCWMVLQDPSKIPAVDQTILNLWDEIDDVKNQRTSGKIFLPFKRSVFPQLFIGFGSAFINQSATPNNPINPVDPGSATYPNYGQLKYYKLPSDW